MQVDCHGVIQVKQFRQQPIRQLRGQNLQEGHRAGMVAHPEGLAVLGEGETGRGDIVLCGEPGFRQIRPVKMKFLLAVRVELAVQKLQTFQPV